MTASWRQRNLRSGWHVRQYDLTTSLRQRRRRAISQWIGVILYGFRLGHAVGVPEAFNAVLSYLWKRTSSFTFLWLILIFLLVVRFSWPLYPSNVPPHFELKSNEMADLKKKKNNRRKKTTTNESFNSHWLPANVAGRLTVLPANCKFTRIWRVVGC